MGFFDHLQKGNAFSLQAKKPQIRKVVQAPPGYSPKSSPIRAESTSTSRPIIAPKNRIDRRSKDISGESDRSSTSHPKLKVSRRSIKRPSPAQRLSSDDDDSDDSGTDTSFEIHKRARMSTSAEPDLNRRVRSVEAFAEDGKWELRIIHAADIASLSAGAKYKTAFREFHEGKSTISLQYPSRMKGERYELVVPRENDDFKPLEDIVQVVEMVSQHYIPESKSYLFNDETSGIKRRLRRSLSHASESEFRATIEDYNRTLEQLVMDGSIARHIDAALTLTLPLVERILTQIYSRTVSPRVESLRRYENGTDNVYGELLPRFISTIFKETHLKSTQIFVDLGSGVGNVVLQAALEIGCESWGCEMMPNACKLADLQKAEFEARCSLWGIAPGKTHLVHGDFLKEESISKTLKQADVVLINNQAFTPQLNNELIHHFLDLKEGCQVVSLKSFVPAGHKIQSRNRNSPINLLTVKQKNYWSNSVSWTDVGGTYFIATKDGSRLKAFLGGL